MQAASLGQVGTTTKHVSCGLWLRTACWLNQKKIKAERGPLAMGILTGIAYVTIGSDYYKLDSAVNPALDKLGIHGNAQIGVNVWVMMSSLVRAIFVTGLSTHKKMNKLDIADILPDEYRGPDFVERWIEYHLEALNFLSKKEKADGEVRDSAKLNLLIDTFFNLDAKKRAYYRADYVRELEKRFSNVSFNFTDENDAVRSHEEKLKVFLNRDQVPSGLCQILKNSKKIGSYIFRDKVLSYDSDLHAKSRADLPSFTYFYAQFRRELSASHEYASTIFSNKAKQLALTVNSDFKHLTKAANTILLKTKLATEDEGNRLNLNDAQKAKAIEDIRNKALHTIQTKKRELQKDQSEKNYNELREAIHQYYLCQLYLNYGEHRHFVKRKVIELIKKAESHSKNLKDAGFADLAIIKLLDNADSQRLMHYQALYKGKAEIALTYASYLVGYGGILLTMMAYAIKSSSTLALLLGSVLFAVSALGLNAVGLFVLGSIALTFAIYKKNHTAGIITGLVLGVSCAFVLSAFFLGSAAVAPYLLIFMTAVAILVYGYQFLRFFNPGIQSTLAGAGRWLDHRHQASSDVVNSGCPIWIKLVISTFSLVALPFLFDVVFHVLTVTIGLSVVASNPVGWIIVGLWGLGQFFFTFSLADKLQSAFKTHLGRSSELYRQCEKEGALVAYYIGLAISVLFLATIVTVGMLADQLGFKSLSIEGAYMSMVMVVSFVSNFIKNVADLSVNLLKPMIAFLIAFKELFTGKKTVVVNDQMFVSSGHTEGEKVAVSDSDSENGEKNSLAAATDWMKCSSSHLI